MSVPALRPHVEAVIPLVRRAGAAVLALYNDGFDVQYKDAARSDPVTSADRLANQMLVDGLRRAFPDDAIIAEESAETPQGCAARQAASRLWCIDPIDGTREFVARSGHFMVMVGLAIDRRAALGVLFQPTEQRLYWGFGDQAWVEDAQGRRPLEVSQKDDPRDATLAISRTHRSPTLERIAAGLGVARRNPTGSIGLKMAKICEQQADVYISTSDRTHEWDVCGPEAILRAAGGKVTDLRGRPLRYNGEDTHTKAGICASNGPLHSVSLTAIRAELGDRVIDD